MTDWIRKNLVLVAGIVLPVVLVAGFLIIERTPRALTDPPEYDFLIVAYRYDVQHPRDFHLSFEVKDGRLEGRATPARVGSCPIQSGGSAWRRPCGSSSSAWDCSLCSR